MANHGAARDGTSAGEPSTETPTRVQIPADSVIVADVAYPGAACYTIPTTGTISNLICRVDSEAATQDLNCVAGVPTATATETATPTATSTTAPDPTEEVEAVTGLPNTGQGPGGGAGQATIAWLLLTPGVLSLLTVGRWRLRQDTHEQQ